MKGQFKIVVPSYNSVRFLPKTLSSIEIQTNKNYEVCVIDDCSTLPQQREIILDYCTRNQWKYIFHKKNVGPLTGTIEAVHQFNCNDDDVIVMLDGDDWLYDEHALQKVDDVYTTEDIYLTWGQFIPYPSYFIINTASPVPQEIIERHLYRQIPDIFNHLRTFKYRLFRDIKDEDFRDPNTGEYFRVSGDKAFMYPMLEMAGEKIRFIPDVLYVYNVDNPIGDYIINEQEQKAATECIRNKKPYSKIVWDQSNKDS